MSISKRPVALAAVLLVFAGALTGCFAYSSRETTRAAPGSTVVVHQPQREYTYPDGRYELHGDGSPNSPYYWVWIPAGVQAVPSPPPPPPFPSRS